MGRIVVDYSALEPLPDSDAVREAAEALFRRVGAVASAVDRARGQWVPVTTMLTSDSMDLDPFYIGFHPPSSRAEQVLEVQRGFRDECLDFAGDIRAISLRRDTLRDTTIPARQNTLDAEVAALPEEEKYRESALTSAAQAEMQGIADRIADDWRDHQYTFSRACSRIRPVVPFSSARFDYGTGSTVHAEGRELFWAATSPRADAGQVKVWYDYLEQFSPDELAALVLVNPAMRTSPPRLPRDPGAISEWPDGDFGGDWWDGLSRDQRQALIAYLPATVGNTEGVPYGVRDQANRNTLDYVLSAGLPFQANRQTYLEIRDSLTPAGPVMGDRYLASFDPNDRPLAAVSVGDLDTAGHVTVMVSGMTSGTHNMTGEVSHAQNVYNGLSGDRAVVSWIGYDSPGHLTVFGDDHAERGAGPLAGFLDGIHETRARHGEPLQVNVMAHSYGTNTAATALTITDHPVQNYIMYGSAGLDPDHVSTAESLNVASDEDGNVQVYATDADEDPWSGIGRFGSWFTRINPTDDDFSAIEFSADSDRDGRPVTGHGQDIGGDDEWGYVEPGSQSYYSIIEILAGRGDDIALGPDDTLILAPGPDSHPLDPAYGGAGYYA